MNDDLILNSYCNRCKLLDKKCEGMFTIKEMVVCYCPYFISHTNSTAITADTKVPHPIVKVVKKNGRATKNKDKE